MSNQIRCIPGETRFRTPRDFSRETISLGASLGIAPEMRLELHKPTRPVATLSVSARHSRHHARAAALLPWNEAVGLRALAHVSASFDGNSPLLWPATHCGRSWVPRRLEQKPRGGQRRKLSCGCSANAFPMMPAARSAPDRRHSPSLRSVATMSAVRRASRSKRSRASVALGSAPSTLARWDSLLLLSRPIQSALGRFLHLSPPGGGSSLSPALWGPAQTSHNPRSSCSIRSGSLGLSPLCRHGAGCVLSPEFPPCGSAGLRTLKSMSFQTVFKQHAKSFQRSISHHANHRISSTR
jgi:hypothetical protein